MKFKSKYITEHPNEIYSLTDLGIALCREIQNYSGICSLSPKEFEINDCKTISSNFGKDVKTGHIFWLINYHYKHYNYFYD